MELEEAIQTLKDFAKYGRYYSNNTEHHMKTAINTVLNHLTNIIGQIEELKAITKTYNAYNTEKDDDKIIVADKRYFDCGVFRDNLIPKSKIIKKLNNIEKECSLCDYKGTFCEKLCKNNQCVPNAVKTMLKELLESEE